MKIFLKNKKNIKFFTDFSPTIFFRREKGFAMIEVLVSMVIASALIITFQSLILQIIRVNHANQNDIKANLYLREVAEIVKDLEQSENGWNNYLASSLCADEIIGCHPVAAGNSWTLEQGSEPLENNKYTRSLFIEPVFRNQDGFPNEIVPEGFPDAVLDDNTKKITITINWNDGFKPRAINLETFAYNYAD